MLLARRKIGEGKLRNYFYHIRPNETNVGVKAVNFSARLLQHRRCVMGKLRSASLFCLLLAACDPVPVQYPAGSIPYPSNYPKAPASSRPSNSPPAETPPKAQVNGSQRWQYALGKAMEGVAMGGAIAGPYGAGGGLIIGLITGLITADSHFEQINTQIQSEYSKDKALANQIEQEMELQRELDAQVGKAADGFAQPKKSEDASNLAQASQKETKSETKLAEKKGQLLLASLSKKAPEARIEMERQKELESQLGKATGLVQPKRSVETPKPTQAAQKEIKEETPAGKKEEPALVSLGKKETPSASPSSPFKNVEVRDINGDGVPDLWIYYNPLKPGEILRQEEATKADGRVDTWSYFNNGKLVRREVDTKGKGKPDIVYYYENDKIAREERDENGDSRLTYRATYQNGRLARVEKDTNGDGKIDLWIYYDTTKSEEVVLKEEKDINGDGAVDLWSYYEGGRLARQDVTAVGLEILSKQEQWPIPHLE